MLEYAENLNFEKAAEIRDRIKILEKKRWGLMKVYKKALITGGAQRKNCQYQSLNFLQKKNGYCHSVQ